MDTTRYFAHDPFAVEACLGSGRSAVEKVYRVDSPQMVYARKRFSLPEQHDVEQVRSIQREISIMRRLRHAHIVKFGGSYICNNLFFVLLLPVAGENMATFFRRIQSFPSNSPQRRLQSRHMIQWPACLFRALDYVHSMRIRHKDIKPSNILIKDGRVILTDFGISKDFTDLTTSGTEGAAGAGTWMYIAPEVYEEQRRGRATDVWGLGCVLLELCTILTGEALGTFEDFRCAGRTGPLSGAYFTSSFRLFDWIWLLMGSLGHTRTFIRKTLALTFLMLDPDPQRRITTRQLVDLLNDPRCQDFHDVGISACDKCRRTIGMSPQDIPLHSIFKKGSNGQIVRPTKDGLTAETDNLWEKIKMRWLESHIWWAEDLWV